MVACGCYNQDVVIQGVFSTTRTIARNLEKYDRPPDRLKRTQTTIRELAQNWCLAVRAIDSWLIVRLGDRPFMTCGCYNQDVVVKGVFSTTRTIARNCVKCDRLKRTQTTIRELAQNWCLTVRAIDFFANPIALS